MPLQHTSPENSLLFKAVAKWALLPGPTIGRLPLLAHRSNGRKACALAYHSITFRDNGIGFSQKHAEQIFGIFQRPHGRFEYAGTGIGLALCKKIAHNHQGDIFATGHKENGAVFQILLPV